MAVLFTTDQQWVGWGVMCLAALFIGISKTGIPGIGVLSVLLAAFAVPAKASTGLILPMLIFGDLVAVAVYRRHAQWWHLVRLIPCAAAGIVLGYFAMDWVKDSQLKPIIGVIILAVLGLTWWRNRGKDIETPKHWLFPVCIGLLAGVTTMMANAAGPIMVIYLAAMRLPKEQFLGTGAWYYLLLNCFKVPFSQRLGLVNPQSIGMNLILAPLILAGALVGILVLRKLPTKRFATIVQIIAAIGAAAMLLPGADQPE